MGVPSKKISHFTELTRDYLRLLVLVRRRDGTKSVAAVAEVAAELGIPSGRAQSLYYGYDYRYAAGVDEPEWLSIRERAATLLMREAAVLRQRAAMLEEHAQRVRTETALCAPGGCG